MAEQDTAFPACSLGTREAVVDALVDEELGTEIFGRPPFVQTRYGARFRRVSRTPEVGTDADEAHPHQCLAALGELGVSLSRRLGATVDLRLNDVLADLIDNFFIDQQEIEWSAIALALYLPPARTWRNRYGVESSFDELANRLMVEGPGRGSCGGAHALQASAILVRVHQKSPILSADRYSAMRHYLRRVSDTLERTQHDDGTWCAEWPATSTKHGDHCAPESLDALLFTGHLAEAALYFPSELSPPPATLGRASRWLWDALESVDPESMEFQTAFCPWTHAACVVRQTRNPGDGCQD